MILRNDYSYPLHEYIYRDDSSLCFVLFMFIFSILLLHACNKSCCMELHGFRYKQIARSSGRENEGQPSHFKSLESLTHFDSTLTGKDPHKHPRKQRGQEGGRDEERIREGGNE